MRKTTSLYLDLLRVIAALVVFATHCAEFWYPELFSHWMASLGHTAVIIFFVLSGYVIAYSTLGKSCDVMSYILARLSRLYSVVLPALALTAWLLVVGHTMNPQFYDKLSRGHETMRFALGAFFLQEIWSINSSPPTNAPLWSLGYEFWYYAVFGIIVFIRPRLWKWSLVTACALLVGYKVMLLMPVWLLGVGMYFYGQKVKLGRRLARGGFWFALLVLVMITFFIPDYPEHPWPLPPFFFSGAFLTDFAAGVALAVNIWCFDHAFGRRPVPKWHARSVRWMAQHTFSLYLFHFPLIVFVTAVTLLDPHKLWETGFATAAILFVVLIMSAFTESKRQVWYRGGVWLWTALEVWFRSRHGNLSVQSRETGEFYDLPRQSIPTRVGGVSAVVASESEDLVVRFDVKEERILRNVIRSLSAEHSVFSLCVERPNGPVLRILLDTPVELPVLAPDRNPDERYFTA